jgi:hypothetical protein
MNTINLYDLKITNNYAFNDVYQELTEFARNKNFKQTFLLNTTSILNDNNNDENKNFIEKFVFDTATFHISEYNKKNNTNVDIRDIYIEFWTLNDNEFKKMHFDKDEQEYLINKNHKTYNKPFLSCITYFNDNVAAPTLITDINRIFGSNNEREDYYTGKHNNFGMVFPKKMKQITFDGGNYLHGMYLLDDNCVDRIVLPINFWFKKPKFLSYFPYYFYLREEYSKEHILSISKKHESINYKKKIFNYNKINVNDVVKNIDISINNNTYEIFNTWYRHLIFGNTPIDFMPLKQHISKEHFVYNFKFSFIL